MKTVITTFVENRIPYNCDFKLFFVKLIIFELHSIEVNQF